MKGAGGTDGGIGQFFIGFVMMSGGFYMLLNAIMVRSTFGIGMQLYGFSAMGGNYHLTTGMVFYLATKLIIEMYVCWAIVMTLLVNLPSNWNLTKN